MNIPFFHVDAFSERAFGGNPAGVCILDKKLPDELMLKLAGEINLVETGFVCKENGIYGLRWFTPKLEIPLCGHGTLAAAHILWETNRDNKEVPLIFETLSGQLTVEYKTGGWIEMNFPAYFPTYCFLPVELQELFPRRIDSRWCHDRYIIELENTSAVIDFQPDFEKLKNHRVVITCSGDGSPYDFISRFFAVPYGVPEDPVTGSAHCCLTPYWSQKTGKLRFKAFQASDRGGELLLELFNERVLIQGRALTLMKGEFFF